MFPANPIVGQVYIDMGNSFVFDGVAWIQIYTMGTNKIKHTSIDDKSFILGGYANLALDFMNSKEHGLHLEGTVQEVKIEESTNEQYIFIIKGIVDKDKTEFRNLIENKKTRWDYLIEELDNKTKKGEISE